MERIVWLYAEDIVLQRSCIDYSVVKPFLLQLNMNTDSHPNVYEDHAIEMTDFWGKVL